MSASELRTLHIPFANTYARLPERFYARVAPTPVRAPKLLELNEALALELGLNPEALRSPQGVEVLAGNRVAEGSEPLAMAYAGHQFGGLSPQLGDGRANLLGEVAGRDLQLKGSGRTPFSRGGDGRAAVGPVLREFLVSEAMHALGVPSTRSLAAVATGEQVFRETALPGAVLTRVAASHLRVGSFEYFAIRGDKEGVRILLDYAVARHYPELAGEAQRCEAFLSAVVERHARLVAQWMLLGFVHGVMNTDNCSIAGETLDYGPCAWMESYDPATVFSSIDLQGRYAYGNQPLITLWNLTRLAEALLPVWVDEAGGEREAVSAAQAVLRRLQPRYEAERLAGMRAKLGLWTGEKNDEALAEGLLERMKAGRVDWTVCFRALAQAAGGDPEPASRLFPDSGAWNSWAAEWTARLGREGGEPGERARRMRAVSPLYIPRNHLVEEALEAASERDDLGPFRALLSLVRQPWEEQPGCERYTLPARPEERVMATFCGT